MERPCRKISPPFPHEISSYNAIAWRAYTKLGPPHLDAVQTRLCQSPAAINSFSLVGRAIAIGCLKHHLAKGPIACAAAQAMPPHSSCWRTQRTTWARISSLTRFGFSKYGRVGRRDDFVVRAPDHLYRLRYPVDVASQDTGLPAVRKQVCGERSQGLGNAVEPLVFEKIVDELSAYEPRIVKQLLEHRLEFAPRCRSDKPVDIGAVDLLTQSGRTHQG